MDNLGAESVVQGDINSILKSIFYLVFFFILNKKFFFSSEVGDYVKIDEEVISLETDKTTIAINSSFNGVIKEFFVEEGQKDVQKGSNLFSIDTSQAKSDAPKQESKKEEAPKVVATPSTPSTPPPSKPSPPTPTPITSAPPTTSSSASTPSGPRERRVALPKIRRRIAERLKDSQNTYALLTTFQECDMSFVSEMRNRYKDEFVKTHGVKLGFMSAFVKASAYALTKFPEVNAVMDGDDIIYRDYVDISVAVATPKGLVVPVIRNAEKLSFSDIEKTIIELGNKAKDGKMSVEEMSGGTFTISNGGVYGSMMGTPIVNPPQSAILGMHNITPRAVVINGKVEVRPIMYLALTYDHRIIDGKGAVSFLRTIKHCVEDPTRILLDL